MKMMPLTIWIILTFKRYNIKMKEMKMTIRLWKTIQVQQELMKRNSEFIRKQTGLPYLIEKTSKVNK